MDYLSFKKLTKIVEELGRTTRVREIVGIYNKKIGLEGEKRHIGPVVLLAKQINDFCPDILIDGNTIDVVIAGSDYQECLGEGTSFNLLNKLLNKNCFWNIRLVGYKCQIDNYSKSISVKSKYIDERIKISMHCEGLSSHLTKHGLPSILTLNNPGFEEYHESWLKNDDGISRCLSSDIRVFGSSYSTDEYLIDGIHLKAYGMKLENQKFNNLCNILRAKPGKVDLPDSVIAQINNGASNSSGTYWELSSDGLIPSKEYSHFIEDYSCVMSSIAKYLIMSGICPQEEVPAHYFFRSNGQRCIRVFNQYALNLDELFIFDSKTLDVIQMYIDIKDFDMSIVNNKSIIGICLLATQIYIDYIKENINDIDLDEEDLVFPKGDSLNFDEMDLHHCFEMLSQFGQTDIDHEKIHESIKQMSVSSVDRKLSREEEEILNIIKSKKYSKLLKLENHSLVNFRDELGRNLFAMAAVKDSIELYEISKQSGSDIMHTDSDSYSFLDTAVEYNAINVSLHALQSGDVSELINRKGRMGFTPLHHAASRRRTKMRELLLKFGARDDIKSLAGITAKEMI